MEKQAFKDPKEAKHITTEMKAYIEAFVEASYDPDCPNWGEYSREFLKTAEEEGWTIEPGEQRTKIRYYGQSRLDARLTEGPYYKKDGVCTPVVKRGSNGSVASHTRGQGGSGQKSVTI